MAASYPTSAPVLPAEQVDGVDTVNAEDVNLVYDELKAVASTLGLTPATRSAAWSSVSYNTGTTAFGTVGARIKNVEDGVQTITSAAVTTAGAKTITVTSDANIGLVLKAKSGQTGNLMEFRASGSDTPVTAIGPSGLILAIDGGTA
jgi:hypothetical protein